MSFNVYWDDDARTILRWDQTGETTVASFRAAYKQSHELTAAIDHQFDLIIIGTHDMPRFPISEMQNAFRNASPKQNMTIIISHNLLSRAIVGVLQKMGLGVTKRITLAANLDEARAFIATRRLTQSA